MPRTALVVVVPEAEPLVGEWRELYDNASLGIPAHVTLLFPFVPTEVGRRSAPPRAPNAIRTQPSFSFSLPRVARFPDVAWLAPVPDAPFRSLTELIVSRYPDYPPYEGIHDEVIPHLTVGVGDTTMQDEIDAALTPHLPIHAEARQVTLLVEDDEGRWRVGEEFPLPL